VKEALSSLDEGPTYEYLLRKCHHGVLDIRVTKSTPPVGRLEFGVRGLFLQCHAHTNGRQEAEALAEAR
jgi:hypothetical protein